MIADNLQRIIYTIATSLLYPVMLLLVIAVLFVVFDAGRFTFETVARFRSRRRLDVEALRAGMSVEGASVMEALTALGPGPVPVRVRRSLAEGIDLARSRLLKALSDGENEASKRLERTRVLVRIGPLLGLMGTLIPISPALVGLAQGDVLTLSNNLVIAFSTTVVGLLVGAVSYVLTAVRERHYREDLADIEYLFDRVVV
ncbi:MAG: MotA/TolQ/ExbB proton channel family protein [Coriobacteriia bacterium]|nr:MotA/TolQ/ExbB proton channel family protein [Coriobacteriia bacterium]